MKREPQCYGLLVGASLYEKHELKRLSGTSRDLAIMKSALIHGLKFNADNIRTLGEDGSVRALSFARALSEFESMTMKEDTFVLYFTGHGMPYGLCFTDETVNIQSIVDFIERLPASRKIVILDCCFSGDMKISGVHEMTFEETAAAFAGRGIAVMASSAPDERSWLSEKGDASLYTCIVASALTSRRSIHEGNISLNDINDEVRYLMQMWNGEHPDRKQHPVYRENYFGDILFHVEEYHPYVTQKITAETEQYLLHSVKPLHTGNLKRFAAFIILKKADDTMLPHITKEIVQQFRNYDVYASQRSEQRFKGRSADAVWCYFGYDEEDIVRSNHFAYSIWAANDNLRKIYYRENRSSEVVDGIYIFWNTSYGIVKELQKSETPDEEILDRYRELAGMLTLKAEGFIRDYEEVENGVLSVETLKKNYNEWQKNVKNIYFRLTDAQPAPAERVRWADAILEMAGWVTDMALFLDRKDDGDSPGENWMVKHAIKRYRSALESLRTIERTQKASAGDDPFTGKFS